MKTLWNDGFEFKKMSVETSYEEACLDDTPYEPVEIPHDFLIYDTNNLYEDATGWYKKEFMWDPSMGGMLLTFDGIYMDSKIYVNQKEAGQWKYGYSSFSINITEYLIEGKNELIVSVCHRSPNSRWYSGAGIYRNVWARYLQDSYIEENGIYIHTDLKKGKLADPSETVEDEAKEIVFSLMVDTNIVGEGTVEQNLYDQDGQQVSMKWIGSKSVAPTTGYVGGCSATGAVTDQITTDRQCFEVIAPKTWSPENPNCYTLLTKLISNDLVVEEFSTTIGFRTVEMDADKGFILNGKQVKINGVCEHHDLGALGAAYHEAAQRRKFKLLKEMGVNAIRFAHNMPDPGCLSLCDEMGLLVMDESFDMWERPKTEFDYARFFGAWHERDMESFVRRDRNHPCVVLWSIGNEIYDTHGDAARGKEITEKLKSLVNRYDYLGNAPVTFASNYLAWENTQHGANVLDAVGYNYTEKYYEKHHKAYPERIIFGSETASIVSSRGIYHFPLEACILSDDDEQCSALANSVTSWGAQSLEACICEDRDMEFSMGQFLWTGTDYIGEPTPYHTKNSYFGQIDTAGFPKDAFYVYQSAWTDYKVKPMIHIFPYWDFNEGQYIDVRVCSNAPDVELFLNGVSLGRQHLTHKSGEGQHILADYKVPYEKGVLKAVAYDDDGMTVCSEEKHSFKDAVKLIWSADKASFENEKDIAFITITAVDCDGYPVENATNLVDVKVKGSGRLVGLDNGDSTDYDSYKGSTRRLFSGKLLAMVMADGELGDIDVDVQFSTKETPVRKIELSCMAQNADESDFKKNRIITPEVGHVSVVGTVLPADATDSMLYFEAVNETGVVTNLVKLSVDGDEKEPSAGIIPVTAGKKVIIHPLGDGAFRLRAMSKSGTDSYRIISELEFEIDGFGTAFLDPYEFVTGSLYSRTNGMEGAGNEKGVATSSDGMTVITYDNLNFGASFASRITMPVFALNDEAYDIHIYEGTPDQGELIGKLVYQKPSIWNVYQEESWELEKKLTGVTTISIVMFNKVHIKGFSFEKEEKAFARLAATQADAMYGDTYTSTPEAVEQIGNNVSLVYRDMDFGEKGTCAVKILGRAHRETNTIHIRFAGDDEEIKQIVEFPASDDYKELQFELTPVKGMKEVSFVFLPGSCFDFKNFQFL